MSKINITKYEEIIERIKVNIEFYTKLENNKYFLGLANGESINFIIPKNCIGHLLGVKFDAIKAAGCVSMDSTVDEILTKLVNYDITYQSLSAAHVNLDDVFSKYIEHKLNIFANMINLNPDFLIGIVKYYPERAYIDGAEKENVDYFIIRRHENNVYSAMGIKRSDLNPYYFIPVTSRLFVGEEELKEFLKKLKGQEVTYPFMFSQANLRNIGNAFEKRTIFKFEEKLRWCRNLKRLSEDNGLTLVCGNDMINTLDKLLNTLNARNNNASIIYYISDSLKQRNIIDKNVIRESLGIDYIPNEISELIDIINDSMVYSTTNDSDISQSYSSILHEKEDFEKKYNESQRELETTKKALEDANQLIVSLKEQLAKSNQGLAAFYDAYARAIALQNSSPDVDKIL